MVLLAHPDDELLVLADVAAAAVGPVRSDAGALQVTVGGHILEHNVLGDELLVLCLIDEALVARGDGHVLASELLLDDQLVEHLTHGFFHGDTVVLGHGARERELLQVTAGAHAHGEGRQTQGSEVQLASVGKALHALQAPVVGVGLLVQVHLVVLAEDGLEEGLEGLVVGGLVGVAACDGVGVLAAGVQALEEGGLGGVIGEGVVVHLVEALHAGVIGPLGLQLEDLLHFLSVCRLVLSGERIGKYTRGKGHEVDVK